MIPGLANHLLQSTVFAVVAGALTLFLRNTHARTRYWIWLTASMKFLIPFSLFVAIGHWLSRLAAPVIVQPQVAIVLQEISQPFAAAEFYATTPVRAASPSSTGPNLLLAFWMIGCAAVLIFWLVRWRRVAAILRASTPIREGRERDILEGIDAKIELISSSSQTEPGVFGILHPVLFLPKSISDDLDDEQLGAVFAHELCHVRFRDNLTAALHMLVEAVFWFHPLVWWIGVKLVEEREGACDEDIVRLGCDPELYAETIIRVCKAYLTSALPCSAGISGSNLRRRIENIMDERLPVNLGRGRKVAVGIAGAMALAAPVAIGIFSGSTGQAQSQFTESEAALPAALRPAETKPQRQLLAQSTPAPSLNSATGATKTEPRPKFDVASIKPSSGDAMGMGFRDFSNGRMTAENTSLRFLIQNAYGVRPFQIFGGPSWIDSGRYNVQATGDRDLDMDLMLQTLMRRDSG